MLLSCALSRDDRYLLDGPTDRTESLPVFGQIQGGSAQETFNPWSERSVFDDQDVREVTASELRHKAAQVVRSIRDGERLVVTRHGRPQAVMLSIRDAVEALVAPRLAEAAADAAADYAGRRSIEPWPPWGPCRLLMAGRAAEQHHRVAGRDKGWLRRTLGGGDADEGRPLWLPTGNRLVPFSYPEPDVALVHDLVDTWPLERELVGEAIWRGELRRDLGRMLHSRGWPQRRLRGQGG